MIVTKTLIDYGVIISEQFNVDNKVHLTCVEVVQWEKSGKALSFLAHWAILALKLETLK